MSAGLIDLAEARARFTIALPWRRQGRCLVAAIDVAAGAWAFEITSGAAGSWQLHLEGPDGCGQWLGDFRDLERAKSSAAEFLDGVLAEVPIPPAVIVPFAAWCARKQRRRLS
jgi:hypothetical protein